MFTKLLIFSHYDGTTPVVKTDGLLCGGCSNQTPLLHWPPVQGTPTAGAKVRLRDANSNKCMYTSSSNPGPEIRDPQMRRAGTDESARRRLPQIYGEDAPCARYVADMDLAADRVRTLQTDREPEAEPAAIGAALLIGSEQIFDLAWW